MKTKKVEIEIPVDMEVKLVRDHRVQLGDTHDLVVELVQRQPRKLLFEEIIGETHTPAGGYWSTNNDYTQIIKSTAPYPLPGYAIAWRLVEE